MSKVSFFIPRFSCECQGAILLTLNSILHNIFLRPSQTNDANLQARHSINADSNFDSGSFAASAAIMAAAPQYTEISRGELAWLRASTGEASISEVKRLASYNWVDAASPTIAVPGSPNKWANLEKPKKLAKDSGFIYFAQNTARHPDYPLEPIFRALEIEQPEFDIREIDIVSDRTNVRKLLAFVDPAAQKGNLQSFAINVEVVGRTAIFCLEEEGPLVDFLGPDDFRGFANEYKKWYTKNQIADNSGQSQSITSYQFDDLKVIIRHETDAFVKDPGDDENESKILGMLSGLAITSSNREPASNIPESKLTIRKEGKQVPLSSTLEIKTRAVYKPLPLEEVAAQLWLSQTPKLVRAYHTDGTFSAPAVEDVTKEIKAWESRNQKTLTTFAALLRKILDVAKTYGRAVIRYDEDEDELVICQVEAARDMLPGDLYAKWEEGDSEMASVER